jgi:hypothetical protein
VPYHICLERNAARMTEKISSFQLSQYSISFFLLGQCIFHHFLCPLLLNFRTRFLLRGVVVICHVTESLIKLLKLQLSLKARANQVIEFWNQNSKFGVQIRSFKFRLVWTDWLSQDILRIYQSWTRPYSQKRIWSSWIVLKVCKSTKIMEFPFRVYIDLNCHNSRIWVPLVWGRQHIDN